MIIETIKENEKYEIKIDGFDGMSGENFDWEFKIIWKSENQQYELTNNVDLLKNVFFQLENVFAHLLMIENRETRKIIEKALM